jgi:S1-C subfamily serine protease
MVVLGFGCCRFSSLSWEQSNRSQFISHLQESSVALVFELEGERNDGSKMHAVRPYCSGAWVDENHILTARHCMESLAELIQDRDNLEEAPDLESLKVSYIINKEVNGVGEDPTGRHVATVIGLDEDHDLALLAAVGKWVPPHQIGNVAGGEAKIGDRVFMMGTPRGLYYSFREGVVEEVRDSLSSTLREGPFVQINASGFYGDSGSSVWNENGEIIGVTDFLAPLPNSFFAIGASSIRTFIKESLNNEHLF